MTRPHSLPALADALPKIGKPSWLPMLSYAARLHEASIHDPETPFSRPWEEIGPGYCYGPAFGHWDLVHAVLDTAWAEPDHGARQMLNYLDLQNPDGMMPGAMYKRDGAFASPRQSLSHPPVWPAGLLACANSGAFPELMARGKQAAALQVGWFEEARSAGRGFFYRDILDKQWESGVDDGIRFEDAPAGPHACVDASCHVYGLYDALAAWSQPGSLDLSRWTDKRDRLGIFIREHLWSAETGFFHDHWVMEPGKRKPMALEGMWPVVVGATTPAQAEQVILGNLMNPRRFFTEHPPATVPADDPAFSLRMWRGPAWNSMTYWAALGCIRYGYRAEAGRLLEKALDMSSHWFTVKGTIFEFYHPRGGDPQEVARKPHTPFNQPSPDYLGHNPLLAMARLWDDCR